MYKLHTSNACFQSTKTMCTMKVGLHYVIFHQRRSHNLHWFRIGLQASLQWEFTSAWRLSTSHLASLTSGCGVLDSCGIELLGVCPFRSPLREVGLELLRLDSRTARNTQSIALVLQWRESGLEFSLKILLFPSPPSTINTKIWIILCNPGHFSGQQHLALHWSEFYVWIVITIIFWGKNANF